MKKTSQLRYTDRVILEKIFLGFLWLLSGILHCFDSRICLVIKAAAAFACIYTILKLALAKKERADEMAEQNMCRAKALVLDWSLLFLCCIAIISILLFRNIVLDISLSKIIPAIVFSVLGINELIVGFTFRKYDRE